MDEFFDFGKPISFGLTAQYLHNKSVTRREWKDSYAAQFVRAFERAVAAGKKLRLPAIDKAYYAGGKQIGWLILSETPYKEALKNMPHVDLVAEGGMCSSVEEFASKYFKGNLDKEVWVVGFKFQPLIDVKACDPVPETIQYSFTTDRAAETPKSKTLTPKSKTLEIFTKSKSDEHFTPGSIIHAAREVMGTIDLDPMSCGEANKTVRATQFFDKGKDGLAQTWSGRVWLNPAFSLANEAVEKLLYSYITGTVSEAVLLLKAAPDTIRHQSLAALPFCEWRGRIKFVSEGNTQVAPFATLIFYLGKNFSKFKEIFAPFGNIRLGQAQVDELENDRRDLLAEVARLQLELAKKSEFRKNSEPDLADYLNRDLTQQIGIGEFRIKELELDREVLPDDLYVRQRIEWQTKLECWKYTQKAISKIQTRLTPEYEELINRQHPAIEEETGYTPDFAPNKLVESSVETGGFLVKIEQYWYTQAGWIAKCNVRISQRVSRGENFLIKTEELFADFHPWTYQKRELLPQYSLGSIRSAKGLRDHFPHIIIPSFAKPEFTEIQAPDGSIWQAYREGHNTRYSVKWRCEVLPNGFSRSPRIDNKKTTASTAAYQATNNINYSYEC
jgi:hypothetical protein